MKYNPFNTSKGRNKPSGPLKELLNLGLIKKEFKILDFGSGKGFDVSYLKNLNIETYGYEPFSDTFKNSEILMLLKKYNVLYCNYVFNVIETLKEHDETLNIIKNINADKKYIAIRCDFSAIKKEWVYLKENNCFFTNKSFQRFYKIIELKKYFGEHLVLKKTNNYILIELL